MEGTIFLTLNIFPIVPFLLRPRSEFWTEGAEKALKNKGMSFCAADFSLLNLPKGKSLGRSKPATNS